MTEGQIVYAFNLEEMNKIIEQQKASMKKTGNPRAICSHEKPPGVSKRDYKGAVFATANIPEGEPIPLNGLEFKELQSYKLVSRAATEFGVVAGWPAKLDIRSGSQLSLLDVDVNSSSNNVTTYLATREISKGEKISADAIKMETMTCLDCPRSAILSKELLLGRKTIRTIKKGSIICSYMFNPEDSLNVAVDGN